MDKNILSLISNFIEITLFDIDDQGKIREVVFNTKKDFKKKGIKNIYEFFPKEDATRVMDMLSIGTDQEKGNFLLKGKFKIADHVDVSVKRIGGKIYVGLKFFKTSRERELLLEKEIKRIKRIAHTDPMTKLLNRYGYWERVKSILNCGDPERGIGILLIDIDKLKTINDTMGHEAGDNAIKQISNLISSSIRARDIAVRYGGDEFVIVVEELSGNKSSAYGLGNRIVKQIKENSKRYLTTVSIGINVVKVRDFQKYLKDEKKLREQWDKAVGIADKMAYKAKEEGRNKVVFSKED